MGISSCRMPSYMTFHSVGPNTKPYGAPQDNSIYNFFFFPIVVKSCPRAPNWRCFLHLTLSVHNNPFCLMTHFFVKRAFFITSSMASLVERPCRNPYCVSVPLGFQILNGASTDHIFIVEISTRVAFFHFFRNLPSWKRSFKTRVLFRLMLALFLGECWRAPVSFSSWRLFFCKLLYLSAYLRFLRRYRFGKA